MRQYLAKFFRLAGRKLTLGTDMNRLALRLLLIATLLAALSAPAAALAGSYDLPDAGHATPAQEEPAADGDDELVDPVVIWSLVGLGVFAAVMGALYYFKREVGGFPENPTWFAPITIMPSKDFPDEGDFGEQVPSAQAHAEH